MAHSQTIYKNVYICPAADFKVTISDESVHKDTAIAVLSLLTDALFLILRSLLLFILNLSKI